MLIFFSVYNYIYRTKVVILMARLEARTDLNNHCSMRILKAQWLSYLLKNGENEKLPNLLIRKHVFVSLIFGQIFIYYLYNEVMFDVLESEKEAHSKKFGANA